MSSARTAERAFWDSSGIVLLCADQPSSGAARRIRARIGHMAIWWETPIEVRSALWRLHREGELAEAALARSLKRLSAIARASLEVAPVEAVRLIAASVVERHDLRAADALQLAAALLLCSEQPRNRPFVCFDARLSAAADVAGFAVLPE